MPVSDDDKFCPDGETRLLGVVGHPIAQVLAPTLWDAAFRAGGVNATCVPFHVHPEDLARFLDGARCLHNLDGLLITVPHKIAVIDLLGGLSERACLVGAANAIRWDNNAGWVGDMLDGVGFVAAFEQSIRPVAGQRALVVGCGGAGSAIAFALAEAGAAQINVADLDTARRVGLAQRLAGRGIRSRVVAPAGRGYDLLVNASPAGMSSNDAIPVDLDGVTGSTAVADVITRPAVTRLLSEARERGCPIQVGARMTEAQIGAQADFFSFGTDPADRREATPTPSW